MRLLFKVIFLFYSVNLLFGFDSDTLSKVPRKPIVRFIRIFGEKSEQNPPILILRTSNSGINPEIGDAHLVVEFDVDSRVPPNLYARFFHCSYDWNEDENIFLNDITAHRTSNIFWESTPINSKYYSFRGRITIPNEQVKFSFAGNWKIKLFDYENPDLPLAEARFFVVSPLVDGKMTFYSDFYKPEKNVTASAFDVEVSVFGSKTSNIIENNLHSVILYRNHRWSEPFVISQFTFNAFNKNLFRYKFETQIYGFVSMGKVFRIDGIPAENGYRVLNLSDLALYPSISSVVRMPLSDIRRRGSYIESHDDGAMITTFITPNYDDYVYMEFILDPEGWKTDNDVFVVGSFNNWEPTRDWQMYYDDKNRLYRLRQWVRRARHNYLYATARVNSDNNTIEKIAFDEFEGNTVTSGHTFIAFVYYRNTGYGGYDEIVGVVAGSYFSSTFR